MVRWARRRAGLSQRELAERAGVPQSTLARIESGAVDPRVGTVRALLRACEMDLEALPAPGIGVDVTLIDSHLRMTVDERMEANARMAAMLDSARSAAQRA